MKCTCEYCSGADYDSSDFFIDPTANLSKERPIGVSGLLRVKMMKTFCRHVSIHVSDRLMN